MKCAICGLLSDAVDEALGQGWILSFYEGDEEHGPACAACRQYFLRRAEGSSMAMKEDYYGRIVYQEEIDPDDDLDDDALIMGMIFN